MRLITLTTIAAITLSACATTTPIPSARKLTPEAMTKMGQTDVVIVKNEDGIRAGWTSAMAAPATNTYTYVPPGTSPVAAGIGGGLGQIIGAAIVDAAPSARAKKSVAAINTGMDKDALDAALIRKIKTARSPDGTVTWGEIETQTFKRKDPVPMDKVKIVPSYTLAEDASAIRVMARVSYENDDMAYQTPYDFGGKPPKGETKGPLYSNVFTYHSDRFIAPELTDEVRTELMEAIESQYAEDVAALGEDPSEKAAKKLLKNRDRALEKAKDDKLSKTETATLLIGQWRGAGSPVLREAISEGQDFIASMLAMDLNNSDVPQYERKEPLPKAKGSFWKGAVIPTDPIGMSEKTVLETKSDGREIIRIDSGVNAGAYHSYPVSGFATYGNTFKTAK